MSAISWFIAGLLSGAAATFGINVLWRASMDAIRRRRLLLAGGLAAASLAGMAVAMYLAIASRQGAVVATEEPAATAPPASSMPPPLMPPSEAMPSASTMSQVLAKRSAPPMEQAAASLAARLERQGGTASDWNLLAQAYDFLGRPEDAGRARGRAAQIAATRSAE